MILNGSGNVGIGTTAPSSLLEIKGASAKQIIHTTSGNPELEFNDSGTDEFSIYYDTGNKSLNFNEGGIGTHLAIKDGGNVGIGTTSPSSNLEVIGDVQISGSLTKASGTFKIDHPLKETHHLVHSFVESPQANNIYRGKVQLENGQATVNLDEVSTMTEGTFILLNRDIHVYTTNETDWDAVRGRVEGNLLTIECQNAGSSATVSWLVIGERQDKHMYETSWTDENGKVIVEPLKTIDDNSE